ncbi:hypothetical protein [Methylorubrum salsuginis]|uniref:Uncharacterized protein n=1 Tax=Methylorubrum salsuginis TaxID=414703 RepID=A0A1I4LPZ3_9HYPH|nr:hypothetical protein [Methylorubrum salsuginis]SFL93082.1 hypothetical protein SAMN04488125_1319 [Methylorubrum salsuginis]
MVGHLSALLDLWRSRRARTAVLASLDPFGESLRRVGEADPRSLDSPYLTGFLLAVVSGLARDAAPRIGSEGLGAVQLDVCGALMGLPRALLAERLVSLGLNEDRAFALGCADAWAFHAALIAARSEGHGALEPGPAAQEAQALWERFIERWTCCTSAL